MKTGRVASEKNLGVISAIPIRYPDARGLNVGEHQVEDNRLMVYLISQSNPVLQLFFGCIAVMLVFAGALLGLVLSYLFSLPILFLFGIKES